MLVNIILPYFIIGKYPYYFLIKDKDAKEKSNEVVDDNQKVHVTEHTSAAVIDSEKECNVLPSDAVD